MLPSINPIPGYVYNGLIFSNGLSHNYACPHDLMRYFLNTKCFQRGINSSKSWKSLVYLKWRLGLISLWLARWVRKRESHKAQVYSSGLFSAAAASGEVAIQQLPRPAALAFCQLQGTRTTCKQWKSPSFLERFSYILKGLPYSS